MAQLACKQCGGARRSLRAILRQIDDCTYRLANMEHDPETGEEKTLGKLSVAMAETLVRDAFRELAGECLPCSVRKERAAA